MNAIGSETRPLGNPELRWKIGHPHLIRKSQRLLNKTISNRPPPDVGFRVPPPFMGFGRFLGRALFLISRFLLRRKSHQTKKKSLSSVSYGGQDAETDMQTTLTQNE